jgi:hypothetical protein
MSITKVYVVPRPISTLGLISTTFNSNSTNGGKGATGYGITGSGGVVVLILPLILGFVVNI